MKFIVTEVHEVNVPRMDEAVAWLYARQAKHSGSLAEYIWQHRADYHQSTVTDSVSITEIEKEMISEYMARK
jgi:hypothetical protein